MGTLQERKAIDKMSEAWRRLTGGGRTASTLPAREEGEEGAREGAVMPPPQQGPPEKPAG